MRFKLVSKHQYGILHACIEAEPYFILPLYSILNILNDWKANCETGHQQQQQQLRHKHLPNHKMVIYTAWALHKQYQFARDDDDDDDDDNNILLSPVLNRQFSMNQRFYRKWMQLPLQCLIPNLFKPFAYWVGFAQWIYDDGSMKRTTGNIAIAYSLAIFGHGQWYGLSDRHYRKPQSFRMPLIKIQNMKTTK